jgi:hypothetical protein
MQFDAQTGAETNECKGVTRWPCPCDNANTYTGQCYLVTYNTVEAHSSNYERLISYEQHSRVHGLAPHLITQHCRLNCKRSYARQRCELHSTSSLPAAILDSPVCSLVTSYDWQYHLRGSASHIMYTSSRSTGLQVLPCEAMLRTEQHRQHEHTDLIML